MALAPKSEEHSYGYPINLDYSRNSLLTPFSKKTLSDRYLLPGEDYQEMFARVACAYSDNHEHAQRMYDYISRLWFMPATPVLSNGGLPKRGMPISCYLNEMSDSLESIVDIWKENVFLGARGGGIGTYVGNLRSIGEGVGRSGKTSGIIPFVCVIDSLTRAISQGSLRRGAAAVYLDVNHPEVEEFIEIRRPTGGDPGRKALNLHHGVVVDNKFMEAVEKDLDWDLISPKSGRVCRTVSARSIWIRLLTARIETGEPYILFKDAINEAIPEHQKQLGLNVKMSNLCTEITLPTGLDHLGNERTAVCCLSSLNLEYFQEWVGHPTFIEDAMRFLDNILTFYIENAPDYMAKARYSAERERSVGLGVMGFHSFLQSKGVPFESVVAKVWNKKIFTHIRQEADKASKKLAEERGACPDAAECGIMERFSNKLSVAPTASISIIAASTSPGIEPLVANSFTHKTLSGSDTVKNRHLEEVLESLGKNTQEVWSSISLNQGSVQHLDFLSERDKLVFKTAFEIDQRWLIEHAADRTPFICQSQSLNLFFEPDISKRNLHMIHMMAWKKGIKSLYYQRSKALQRAESKLTAGLDKASAPKPAEESSNYEECLSCQ